MLFDELVLNGIHQFSMFIFNVKKVSEFILNMIVPSLFVPPCCTNTPHVFALIVSSLLCCASSSALKCGVGRLQDHIHHVVCSQWGFLHLNHVCHP